MAEVTLEATEVAEVTLEATEAEKVPAEMAAVDEYIDSVKSGSNSSLVSDDAIKKMQDEIGDTTGAIGTENLSHFEELKAKMEANKAAEASMKAAAEAHKNTPVIENSDLTVETVTPEPVAKTPVVNEPELKTESKPAVSASQEISDNNISKQATVDANNIIRRNGIGRFEKSNISVIQEVQTPEYKGVEL